MKNINKHLMNMLNSMLFITLVATNANAEVKINTGKAKKPSADKKVTRIIEAKTGIPLGATTGGYKRFNIKGSDKSRFVVVGPLTSKNKKALKISNIKQTRIGKSKNIYYSFTPKVFGRRGSSIVSTFINSNSYTQGEPVSGSGPISQTNIDTFNNLFGEATESMTAASSVGDLNYDPCDPAYTANGNSCRFGSCNNNNQSCRGAKVTFKDGKVASIEPGTACCIAGAVSAFQHCGGGYNCGQRNPDPRCEQFPSTPYGYDGHECGRSGFLCCSASALSLIYDRTGSIAGYNCGSCVDNTSAFHQPLPAPSDPSKVPPEDKFDCNPGFQKCGSTSVNPYGNGECGRKRGDTFQCKAPIEDGYNTQECCSGRAKITGTLTTTDGCVETNGHANGCSAICECQ